MKSLEYLSLQQAFLQKKTPKTLKQQLKIPDY